jgi:hypothetical protein
MNAELTFKRALMETQEESGLMTLDPLTLMVGFDKFMQRTGERPQLCTKSYAKMLILAIYRPTTRQPTLVG